MVIYNIYMERFRIFNGKTHYFDWAMFNSYGKNYQRVGGKHPTIYRLSTVQISSIHSMFITTSAVNCHKCIQMCWPMCLFGKWESIFFRKTAGKHGETLEIRFFSGDSPFFPIFLMKKWGVTHHK